MKDQRITICVERGYYFGGEIENGKLSLVSEVYGDDFESERWYEFSVVQTLRNDGEKIICVTDTGENRSRKSGWNSQSPRTMDPLQYGLFLDYSLSPPTHTTV